MINFIGKREAPYLNILEDAIFDRFYDEMHSDDDEYIRVMIWGT